MITNLIYIIVAFILIYVVYIATKAVDRGLEAKKNLKNIDKLENEEKNQGYKNKINISSEIEKLNKLYEQGALNEKEFKRAKEKILK